MLEDLEFESQELETAAAWTRKKQDENIVSGRKRLLYHGRQDAVSECDVLIAKYWAQQQQENEC